MTNITENQLLTLRINLEAQRILAQISNNHPAAIANDLYRPAKNSDPIFPKPKLEQTKQSKVMPGALRLAHFCLAQIAQVATDCAALNSLKSLRKSLFLMQQFAFSILLPSISLLHQEKTEL